MSRLRMDPATVTINGEPFGTATTVEIDFSQDAYLKRVEAQRATCKHDWQAQATSTPLVCAKCSAVRYPYAPKGNDQ